MTKTETHQFKQQGFVELSEADYINMDLCYSKNRLGYPVSNHKEYQQPTNLQNRDKLQAELEGEVANSDAYLATRHVLENGHLGQLKATYTPYWEKFKCIAHASFSTNDPKVLRDEHAEALSNALSEDGRLSDDKISSMSLEQLRRACRGLGL